MSINWHNQSIVMTGAYGGLGTVLSEELNRLGAQLIITGRDTDKLRQLKDQLSEQTIAVSGDITSLKFRNDLIEILASIQSQEHLLINNAGISNANFLQQQNETSIKQMLDINLLSPILLSQALLPWLQKAKKAKIINIGSTFGAIGYPGFSTYCASKFGLRGFSQALSRELKDTTIDVQYLAPRAMKTAINSDKVNQLNEKLKNKVDSVQAIVPQIIAAIEKNTSEKHFGFPEKLFTKINGLFPKLVSRSIHKQNTNIQNIFNNNPRGDI